MNNIKTLRTVIGIVLTVIIIFSLYGIFFKDKLDKSKRTDPNIVNFDTITTNVQGGDYNYLKIDISLQSPNDFTTKNIKEYKNQIRRTLLNIAMSQDGKTLLTPKGKEMMKNRIKLKIKREFGVDVKSVYFSNFVMAD